MEDMAVCLNTTRSWISFFMPLMAKQQSKADATPFHR